MTVSRTDKVICYGDSQTSGFSWGNRLPALSETITEAIGRGVSGQEAGTVAVRQGGIVLTTTAACTIPTTGEAVDVPVSSSVAPCNIRFGASDMPVVLSGVRGVLTVIATADSNATTLWDRSLGAGTLRFTPTTAPASEVAVPSGTSFISQDVADHPEWAECLHIIWVGGNDAAFAGESRVTGVVSAVTAMVDRLRETVDEPRFLVAGRTTGTTNVEGTSSWQTAVDQHAALLAAFPDQTIDIWRHVRDNGLSILGVEPTQADLDALAGKTVPPSLTSDGLHYTTATREQVLAPYIISELAARGWTTPKAEVIPMPDYTPKTDWVAGAEVDHDHLNALEGALGGVIESASSAAQGVADLRAATTAELAKKVSSSTAKNTVYGIGADGAAYQYPVGASTKAAGSLAMRGTDGATRVGPATLEDHAVPKAQMDTALSAKADSADVPTLADFNALVARVTALETPPSGE
ncbi:SGNH/GDSL hydrolase family protein [Corynebacterium provencense]|uniref:SGNH/GDSL hydrolase family protein n=1 Tax=Corynebacterium provencense TaxID=1737425 RepID=UPI000835B085|nr:SGNH/GDSL hydrolase family protein [Corynebacterium provencense]